MAPGFRNGRLRARVGSVSKELPEALTVLASVGLLVLLALLGNGCAHRQAVPPVYSTEGDDVRGHELEDLRLTLSDHGLHRWRMPLNPRKHEAGSPFGPRIDPITGEAGKMHSGQDIGCRRGAPVFAVAAGTVVISARSKSAGKWIVIEHGERDGHVLQSRYLHLSLRFARKGQRVGKGTIIGACGSTGRSTCPHLHFGIYVDGEPVPPVSVRIEPEAPTAESPAPCDPAPSTAAPPPG